MLHELHTIGTATELFALPIQRHVHSYCRIEIRSHENAQGQERSVWTRSDFRWYNLAYIAEVGRRFYADVQEPANRRRGENRFRIRPDMAGNVESMHRSVQLVEQEVSSGNCSRV